MARGRPSKKPKNISGLRNQISAPNLDCSHASAHGNSATAQRSRTPSVSDGESEAYLSILFDSLKTNYAADSSDREGSESDVSEQSEWEELDDKDFASSLADLVAEDDPQDQDWIPNWLQKQLRKQSDIQKGEH
jgi:hypothetical protein